MITVEIKLNNGTHAIDGFTTNKDYSAAAKSGNTNLTDDNGAALTIDNGTVLTLVSEEVFTRPMMRNGQQMRTADNRAVMQAVMLAYVMEQDDKGKWKPVKSADGKDVTILIPADFLNRRVYRWSKSMDGNEPVITRGEMVTGNGGLNNLWRNCFRKTEAIHKIIAENKPFQVTVEMVETAAFDADLLTATERRGDKAVTQNRPVYSAEWV